MDTGLLNVGEEHFGTFNAFQDYDHAGDGLLDRPELFSEWEDEREINGDIALIPVSGSFCENMKDLSEPPSEFFQKFLDWQSFINIDVVGTDNLSPDHELNFGPDQEHVLNFTPELAPFPPQELIEPNTDDLDDKNFNLAKYINGSEPRVKKFKAPVKKIDRVAQKYIIAEETIKIEPVSINSEDVDIETVYEPSKMPVLEAPDVLGLLEQFEASEKPNLVNFHIEKVCDVPTEIFADDKKGSTEVNKPEIIVKKQEKKEVKVEAKIVKEDEKKVEKKTDKPVEYVKNKQILEALPQELIARIAESGKRKTITVIPPIPNKKRGAAKTTDSLSQIKTKVPKITATSNNSNKNNRVQMDHDYCSLLTPYPKEPIKDSGFESAEEDERAIIRNQPTVKNADGKLMVSLLKVNTIRTNQSNNSNLFLTSSQKKKLNLEEYKKRRFINSNATSLSNSPSSSTCSSPLPHQSQDDILRNKRYLEKLQKMKEELLNTPPKSAVPVSKASFALDKDVLKTTSTSTTDNDKGDKTSVIEAELPPDMDRVIVVSVATNTDITEDVKALEELQEIQPLLKRASDKINSSSLINSLIENIPKAKCLGEKKAVKMNQEVVRENKVIVYLPKNRPLVETCSVQVQTTISSMVEEKVLARYRRRTERGRSPSPVYSISSGTSSENSNYRGRRGSRSSRGSRRSDSSSSLSSRRSVSSRSRSRSVSPKRPKYSPEYVREVEERRVVYVGHLPSNTSHEDLRRRFQKFGNIKHIKINHREEGDPYGFVTFTNREDAYQAVEHGNDGHVQPKYDLSFGGRRLFCQATYSDLDNVCDDEFYGYGPGRAKTVESFDALLREFQSMRNRRKL